MLSPGRSCQSTVQGHGEWQQQRRQHRVQAGAVLHPLARLPQLVGKPHRAILLAASPAAVTAPVGVMSRTPKLSASDHRLIASVGSMNIAKSTGNGRNTGRGSDLMSVRNTAGASAGGSQKSLRTAIRTLTLHLIDDGTVVAGQGPEAVRSTRRRAWERVV